MRWHWCCQHTGRLSGDAAGSLPVYCPPHPTSAWSRALARSEGRWKVPAEPRGARHPFGQQAVQQLQALFVPQVHHWPAGNASPVFVLLLKVLPVIMPGACSRGAN